MSKIDDRCRLLSSIEGVLVSSIASWGREKNRPNTTYPNSKEEEKAILNARIQIHERVTEPNGGRRPIDELLCACMHARAICNIAEDSDDDDSVQTDGSVLAEELTVAEMVHHGQVAEKELGLHPREDSRAYTNFHQAHFGQVAPVLLRCLLQKTIPPCSLHLILSVHRVFWKIIHSFTKLRQQEHLIIIPALRQMGCQYMVFQLESYFKTKGKLYDGSATLRLTGNDCRTLEENIQSFCQTFLDAPTVNNTRKLVPRFHYFWNLFSFGCLSLMSSGTYQPQQSGSTTFKTTWIGSQRT